jgi:hypothetical protein
VLLFSLDRERECVERAGGAAEMPLGEMQVDRRFLKVAMTQQHLDGAQVGAGFEQMRGKTVAQRMGMDMPVLEACPASRAPAHVPDRLVGDRLLDSTMAIAAREQIDPRPLGAPVRAQRIQQPGTEHDVTVLAALAAVDMDEHALAIDIADLERGHLCTAAAGRVERHEHGALKGCPGRLDQTCDFFPAEHLRQVLDRSRIRRLGCTPAALQHLDIKESQCCKMLPYRVLLRSLSEERSRVRWSCRGEKSRQRCRTASLRSALER